MNKDARIDLRCSRFQKEGIMAAAKEAGVSVSDLLLSCVRIVKEEGLESEIWYYAYTSAMYPD